MGAQPPGRREHRRLDKDRKRVSHGREEKKEIRNYTLGGAKSALTTASKKSLPVAEERVLLD